MSPGKWLARNFREAAEAERQSTSDAVEIAGGLADGIRAAVASYRHDKANEEAAPRQTTLD
jgi:prephenate dehydratase